VTFGTSRAGEDRAKTSRGRRASADYGSQVGDDGGAAQLGETIGAWNLFQRHPLPFQRSLSPSSLRYEISFSDLKIGPTVAKSYSASWHAATRPFRESGIPANSGDAAAAGLPLCCRRCISVRRP